MALNRVSSNSAAVHRIAVSGMGAAAKATTVRLKPTAVTLADGKRVAVR